MLRYFALISVLLGICDARELAGSNGLADRSSVAESSLNVKVTVDVSKTHPVALNLWGIFFEEVRLSSDITFCETAVMRLMLLHLPQCHMQTALPLFDMKHASSLILSADSTCWGGRSVC